MTISRNLTDWFEAVVEEIVEESPNTKTFRFKSPFPVSCNAGQRFELQLTAENGYKAARPYSSARASDNDEFVTLTVMNVVNGEVSPYVVHDLAIGDTVELRGPFGKFFVWTPDEIRPVLLIGGGSGIIPLHAMFTSHRDTDTTTKMKMLYSSHTHQDILFKDTLLNSEDVTITLTREQPPDWQGANGRITIELLKSSIDQFAEIPLIYICGMSGFVEHIADGLMQLDVPIELIRTERFG